jgi:tetratricopeptide (TPR) repeat protein
LVETAKGDLALTVRGNGVPAKTFGGSATDLETLTVQAAEYIYARSQPARWASYLTNAGRDQEALAFCPSAIPGADPQERPGLLNTWGLAIQNTGGSMRESLELFRTAIKLNPDTWAAHNNIMNSLMMLGDEEGAWKAGEELRKAAGGRPGRAPEAFYQNWDNLTWNLGSWLDAIAADAETNAGAGANATSEGPLIADVQVRLHDPAAAELAIKTTKEDAHDPTIGAITHFVRGRIAAVAGDTARAATEMEAFGTAYGNPVVSANYPGYHCWIAPTEEAAGHPDKADALLKTAGTFVDCYRFRADILDGRSDWPGAQKVYAEALSLAPDLPAAYYSWGIALAKHGDLEGALAKFKDANQRGPHWADPLKAWGDVLVKQDHPNQALTKYREALKYAPNWKQLKEAYEALARPKT